MGNKKISKSSIKSHGIGDLGELQNVKYEYKKDRYIKKWICTECKEIFVQDTAFYEHLSDHRGIFRCTVCEKFFPNLGQIAAHLAMPHPDESNSMTCKICDLEYSSRPMFVEHINLHFNIRPYACDICNKRYCKAFTLRAHKINAHQITAKKKKQINIEKNRKILGLESSASVLVDRIDTPGMFEARRQGDVPLAIFKDGGESKLVRVMSAFATKDLLVPVPSDELSSYRVEQAEEGDDTPDTVKVKKAYSSVPVIAIVEKKVDDKGVVSLTVSEPTDDEKRRYPVKLPTPTTNLKSGTAVGGNSFNPKRRVPTVKIFRKEVEGNFVSKRFRNLRKLEEAAKFECHFADMVDFGSLK